MFTLRRILVPTDFSAGAAAALDYATKLAKHFDAEIVLVHVLNTIPLYLSVPSLAPLPSEWVESVRMQAEAELAKEAHRVAGVKVTAELRDGATHESLLTAAVERKADLIVIGTHGRTGLKHAMLGSVAERMVRHSTFPVLTVRAPKAG